jgi:c-di-GMP-binding flagellar brake protein YcgR
MDTLPMPLDQLAAKGNLGEFRVTGPFEIRALLRDLLDGAILVNLNSPAGVVYTTTLWTLDTQREQLNFAVDPDDPKVAPLLEHSEATVVAYLDSIKVQFDVGDLMLVRGARSATLSARFPLVAYRFQRRNSFRVRPPMRSGPVARLRHPQIPDMTLELRILDVSVGGCALLLPSDVPPVQPGVLIARARIELDGDTRFDTALRIQHVASLGPDSTGVRLGCEMLDPEPAGLKMLQVYVDKTQRRRRLISLD